MAGTSGTGGFRGFGAAGPRGADIVPADGARNMRHEGRRGSLRMTLGRLVAAVGIAGAVLVGLAIAGMILASNGYRDAGVRAVNRQASANQILVDLLNAETGNRGYILTGRGDYLLPYLTARRRYDSDIARMRDLVAGEPTLESQLQAVDRTAQLWFDEAVKEIRLRRSNGGQGKDQAIARVNEGVGQARLDAFRAAHEELLAEVQAVRQDSLDEADLTRTVTLAIVSAAALAALFVVIIAVTQLWRRIGVPVASVAEGVSRVSRGRFTDPVPESDHAVAELAELTTGFNEMQSQLSQQRDQVAQGARREAAQDAERRLWDTLQAGLLPLDLPRIPGLRIVARYEPAERGLLIGGDFYDVVSLRDGRLALAVGDLAGHGAPVAARAAGLRFGWRTLVEVDPEPDTVMDGLNRQLSGSRERAEGVFASLLYVLMSPGGRLQLSCAGHPQPLLLAGPECGFVDVEAGPVLGVMDRPEWPVTEVTLPPGGTIMMFTDGLTEARRGLDFFGEDRIRDVVFANAGAPLEARVERLIDAARRHDDHDLRDDVVVLALERIGRFQEGPPPQGGNGGNGGTGVPMPPVAL